MNTTRKLVKFLIDIFLLNTSLVISIFLKYDQLQITNKNINFLIYFNLSFCIIYFILMSVLNMLAVMYPYSSPFVTWYIDRFESVMPLTQYGRLYSRANILSMLILLIPVILIIAGPLFVLILLITDIELNKELREHFGDLDE